MAEWDEFNSRSEREELSLIMYKFNYISYDSRVIIQFKIFCLRLKLDPDVKVPLNSRVRN